MLLNPALFFSEKALRDYTLTPRPPPALQDPRPRISIYFGRYAFAYTCIIIPNSGFLSREKSEFRVSVAIFKVLSS